MLYMGNLTLVRLSPSGYEAWQGMGYTADFLKRQRHQSTLQYLLGSKPARGPGHLRQCRAARHPSMAHQLLRLGALLRRDARGWRRLQAACGEPGCAWRHPARGARLGRQLGTHAGCLLASTWRHALPCNVR